VQQWRSVSVVAPVCVAAGGCATIAMLLGAEAPAFLDAHAAAWLAVAHDGTRFGTTIAAGTAVTPERT
jgi:thiamine biosynthesis lipoprotein